MIKSEPTEAITHGDRMVNESTFDESSDFELFKTPRTNNQKMERIVNVTNIFDNFPTPEKYRYGEDFVQFCEQFKRYVKLNKLDNTPNLHLRFLSLLDTKTDIMFTSVKLTESQQSSVEEFCKIYLQNFDPILDHHEIFKRVLNVQQKPGQNITDYAFEIQRYIRQFESYFEQYNISETEESVK